jgi:hypothetical protein
VLPRSFADDSIRTTHIGRVVMMLKRGGLQQLVHFSKAACRALILSIHFRILNNEIKYISVLHLTCSLLRLWRHQINSLSPCIQLD